MVNLAAPALDLFCALTVAMVRSCCATNWFERNRSPRRNPGVSSPRDWGHNAFSFQVGSCSSHIRRWNYWRVWCGQVSQHQRSACLRILRDDVLVQKRKVWRLQTFCGTSSHNQCCHCWGFFTRSGGFLFYLRLGFYWKSGVCLILVKFYKCMLYYRIFHSRIQ